MLLKIDTIELHRQSESSLIMPLDPIVRSAVIFAAVIVGIVVVTIVRRRALRKLVRERFYAGRCIICGAGLRLGKELCPKCGHKVGWLEAQIWDEALERKRAQQQASDVKS